MKHKHRIDQLQNGVKSILAKSGYAFSEEDKTLLEAILLELEEMSNNETDNSPNELLKILSLLLRFLKFFGIDDIIELF
ncbi:hypothetical protein DWB61_11525 [Ancylomarina euxinus]|uniref:Uncharacterized protein n=1 Tax=Ancylomarina euxinus TaxID=2283627 RepID=A0A425XZE3_9BACT|nr:hypothetical protein [Ancylomarina euxinus]MCZ4695532.1 hypothetical protein [Ancylomarina euxinus]MUP15651.1 hypothetical protein [Ancylomarina euxinus]RRG20644.1 hypothetical protein DWB61_11525 [Ancylomarina euxinus]